MSFFRRLFGGDPQKLLEKAERALAGEQAAEALDLFRRAGEAAGDRGELRERALDGCTRASAALRALNLREAELSLEGGDPESAVNHLQTALEMSTSDEQRAEIEARLERAVEDAERDAQHQALFVDEGAIDEVEDPPELQWERLLGTLDDEVAEDYRDRGEPFRDAVLALNDGRIAAAIEQLEALHAADEEQDEDDPLVHFELGRALLAAERFDDAARELELAREEIGFDALDRAGLLNVPLLEGEALLLADRPADARALLDDAIEEIGEEVGLLVLRGRAEMAIDDGEAVEQTFSRVLALQPQMVEAAQVLAEYRAQRGDLDGAAEVLEQGIKRHCATGTCAAKPISVPAARLLADLYLRMERKLDRVEDLMLQVKGGLEGHVSWADHVRWARLHRLRDEHDAFAAARDAALAAIGDDAPPDARAQIQRLLEGPA